MINYSIESFEQIYRFFKSISGSHDGILYDKIYQAAISDENVNFHIMTSDFPHYDRILNYKSKITYHLSGYGCSREEALIRLTGESIERYSVVFAYDFLKNFIIYDSYDNLVKSDHTVMDLKYLNVYNNEGNKLTHNIADNEIIGWIRILSVLKEGYIYVPAQLFFISYFNGNKVTQEPRAFISVSTGTATHTSYKKSLENALIEYLQIDSFMLSWYAKDVKVPEVVLDEKFKLFLNDKKLISNKHELLILDMTIDKPFPVFGVFIMGEDIPYISFGVQGGRDPYQTLYRAILEASTILEYNYSAFVYDKDNYDLTYNSDNQFLDLDSNVIYWASEKDLNERMSFLKSRIEGKVNISDINVSDADAYELSIKYCKDNNFDIGALDITCAEIGVNNWNTIRCIIPQLLPMCIPSLPFVNHPRMKKFGGCVYEFPHPLP